MKKDVITTNGNEGIALIWASLVMFALMLFAVLVINTGYMVVTRGQLQTTADAAALAGARFVQTDQALARGKATYFGLANRAAAVHIQLDPNVGNSVHGDIVLGRYDMDDRIFTPDLDNPNAVMVNARRTDASLNESVLMPLLMPNANTNNIDIAASAIARVQGGFGAGVIALNEDQPCSLDLDGSAGSLNVDNGAIYVNSDDPEAVCHSGKPDVGAEGIYTAGDFDKNFEKQANYDGDMYPDSDPIPDPLADLPAPFYDTDADLGTVHNNGGGTMDLIPGYYSGGITQQNGTLNLAPGIYILDGAGLNYTGGTLNAEGVMFYVVGGPIDIRGDGIVNITAPDSIAHPPHPASADITPYEESAVAIFQARNNTTPSRVLGLGDLSISGTMYFPVALLEVGGTSTNFSNGLIADTIWLHGDTELDIDYQGHFGTLPARVFLVE
jgi:hypothetical protein